MRTFTAWLVAISISGAGLSIHPGKVLASQAQAAGVLPAVKWVGRSIPEAGPGSDKVPIPADPSLSMPDRSIEMGRRKNHEANFGSSKGAERPGPDVGAAQR